MVYIFSLNDSFERVEIAVNLLNYSNDIILVYEKKFQHILHTALAKKNLQPIDDSPAHILLNSKPNNLKMNIE